MGFTATSKLEIKFHRNSVLNQLGKFGQMSGCLNRASLGTPLQVMDDNKILTLASNERIALSPSMRLLFEISHLRTATPATVSRAGILFINPADLGWNP